MPTYDEIRAELAEYNPDAIMFEAPDYASALVGWTHDYRAVYDMDLCIEHLVEHDGMTHEEAEECFSYNTLRALDYMDAEHRPVLLHRARER